MDFYLILLLIFVALWARYFHSRYGRRGQLFGKIPGPKDYPFIGSLLMFNFDSMRK